MTNQNQIHAAEAAANLIDADVLALVAKANQTNEMANAETAFQKYWAGSVSSSVCHYANVNAVRTVKI